MGWSGLLNRAWRPIAGAAALIQQVTLTVNESAVAVFDDERVVANAGLMLPAVLAGRLGIAELVDEAVHLGDRPETARPGRKVMSLVSVMALGADCIDDCDVLRFGSGEPILLVHGFPHVWQIWGEIIPGVAREHRAATT